MANTAPITQYVPSKKKPKKKLKEAFKSKNKKRYTSTLVSESL